MKFYNRKKEMEIVQSILKKSKNRGQLTVFQGKRRIGKTTLILKALENQKFLYFFVGKKTETELLNEFSEQIKNSLNLPYQANFNNMEDLLKFLFDYSKKEHLIVVFDEFQNFKFVKPSIFSEIQKLWDLNKDNSKIALFCIGSMFTLIKKIFTSYKEPLYNRANQILEIKSFDLKTQVQVLKDLRLLEPRNFLTLYSVFNGTPKYLESLEDNDLQGKSINQIIETLFCQEEAYLLKEGKNILIEEFGKSYDKYFAILAAIASRKTTKNEIHNYTGININSLGSFLNTLENFYELIERKTPILENSSSKISSYQIKDNFLAFWFRYIYKKSYLLEIKDYKSLCSFIIKDLDNFLGFAFENFIKDFLILQNNSTNSIFNFQRLGSFWKRPSKKDSDDNSEIDIVAINEDTEEALIGECKLNSARISQELLDNIKEKTKKISKISRYKFIYYVFTLDNLPKNKKDLLEKNGFNALEMGEVMRKL